MDNVETFAGIIAGLGLLLGGIGVWIRARAKVSTDVSEAARKRDLWEQDTIDKLRMENVQFWTSREKDLIDRLESMRLMSNAHLSRIETMEVEIAELRADGQRKADRIEELTKRVHQLEVENARLTEQRNARDEKIELLMAQIEHSAAQTAGLLKMTADISTLVQAYTARADGHDAAQEAA